MIAILNFFVIVNSITKSYPVSQDFYPPLFMEVLKVWDYM